MEKLVDLEKRCKVSLWMRKQAGTRPRTETVQPVEPRFGELSLPLRYGSSGELSPVWHAGQVATVVPSSFKASSLKVLERHLLRLFCTEYTQTMKIGPFLEIFRTPHP